MPRKLCAILATFFLGCACTLFISVAMGARADDTYTITREVWDGYQSYLSQIGSTRAGAFAITKDGRRYYYRYCPAMHCMGSTTYSHEALKMCESNYGAKCVIFAVRRDIRLDYKVQ